MWSTNFIPFRACDMDREPGGYVQVHVADYGPVWARLERLSESSRDEGAVYRVGILGCGESACVFLSELSIEDQRRLLLMDEIVVLQRLIESGSEALRERVVTATELKELSLLLDAALRVLGGAASAPHSPPLRMAAR